MPIAAAGCTIEAAVAILRSSAHFNASDVADANHGTVGIGTQYDGGELLGPGQPALGLDVDLNLLLVGDRGGADAADRPPGRLTSAPQ